MGPPGMGGAGGGTGARARDLGGTLRRLSGLMGAQRLKIALILAATAGSAGLGAIVPWQLGRATDLLAEALRRAVPIDFHGLAVQLASVGLLVVGGGLLNWQQAWLTNALVQALSRTLRQQAEEKLARLPLAWFDRQPHGEVLSRVTNDIDNVNQSLQQLLSQLVMSALQVVFVIGMMLLLSPVLALAAMFSLAVSLLAARAMAGLSRQHFIDQGRWTGVLNGEVEQDCTGHTLMKVFGHQARARVRFEADNTALRRSAFSAQFLSGTLHPAMMFIGNLSFIVVVIGGAWGVMRGAMTVGQLQSFIQYIRHIGQPISQVAGVAPMLQTIAVSAERVFELLDAPELRADEGKAGTAAAASVNTPVSTPVSTPGHVQFEHVTFRYDPKRPLFEDVSLEALPGQTVAIVGPTGAGKTTLVNLLMRFYEIDAGVIRLGGVDTRTLRREDLRRHFGMVLQDTWLFSGTVSENIAYGRTGATQAEVAEAAKACHVDEFVQTLPLGYETRLDENGGGLSVGQRQLLTIARAFIAQPGVLILDEATSSVDTRTELLVQRAMARLRTGRTSFVIAHRLSTIRDADVILYMEAGNLLERGNHDALMALHGHYWQMVQSQFDATAA
jgi:ATP-binding cassette subfamily B protein